MNLKAKLFLVLLKRRGVPLPVTEYRFHPLRKWRMDFCWPDQRVGLEVDGGIWTRGRHTRGAGWIKDTEKLNAAAGMGYWMLRTTPDLLYSEQLLTDIQAALTNVHDIFG